MNSFTVNDANGGPTATAVKSALSSGLLTEHDIDVAAGQALSIRFRLGEFDPDGGPYAGIGPAVIDSAAHRQLARETADQAMVLLKNDRNALPLPAGRQGRGRRPARRHALHRLVRRQTALPGDRGRRHHASRPRSVAAQRRPGPDRAQGRTGNTWPLPAPGTRNAATVTATATSRRAVRRGRLGPGRAHPAQRRQRHATWAAAAAPCVTRDEQPNGWNVQQQWKLEAQTDGTYVLHYVGYDGSRLRGRRAPTAA